MANYDDLKKFIADYIHDNGRQEITGNVLQGVLREMATFIGTDVENKAKSERDRAMGEEKELQDSVADLDPRVEAVEASVAGTQDKIDTAVAAERTRAQAVEADLQEQIDAGGGGGEPVDAYTKAETDALLAKKANDNGVVKTNGAQNIDGAKNFRDRLAAGNILVGRQAYLATGGTKEKPVSFIGEIDAVSARSNFFGFRIDKTNRKITLVRTPEGVDGTSSFVYGDWGEKSGKDSEVRAGSTTMVQGQAVYGWGVANFYNKGDVDARLALKSDASNTVTTDTQQTITGYKSFRSIEVKDLDIPPTLYGTYHNITVSSPLDSNEARLSLRALNKDTASYFQVLSDNATGGNEFFFKTCNETLSDPFSDEDTHSEIVEVRPKESNDKETFSGATAKDERTIPTIKAIKGYVEDRLAELPPGGVSDDSVYTAAIQDGAVTTEKIAGGAVTSGKIASSAVTSSHLAADCVTGRALAFGCVGWDKIEAGAVKTQAIGSGAVTTEKIAFGAVTSGEIAGGAVTEGELGEDVKAIINGKKGFPIIARQGRDVYVNAGQDVVIPPEVGDVFVMCPGGSTPNGSTFTIYNYSVARNDIKYGNSSTNLPTQQIIRCVLSNGKWLLCYVNGEAPLSAVKQLP